MTEGIFIGLGSNLGDRRLNLQRAAELLQIEILKNSSLYETEPVGYLQQPWFLNSVIWVQTELSPVDLLRRCQEVEKKLGRKRDIPKGPRTLDLDVLFFNQVILNIPDLILPHPAIPERRFVLEPLNEIAPDFIHPVLLKIVSELLRDCPDQSIVRKL
jgi:2-amino-4-hydroxy-6-hydroxymethyldihydropteridine diphosphokinase